MTEGFSYIGTKDVSFDGKIDYDNGVKIPFQNNFRRALKNSVLLCIEGGSAGRKISLTDREVCFGNKLCNFYSESIFNSYIYFYLQSPAFRKNFYDNLSGMIGGVSIKKLNLIPICLPPLAEQERIVERVEKILSEVELLAESERELDNLQKNFPRRMKNSILQAAIQGKLTEQLSNDGDARELLKKIREEKSKLIAEGKIKSEKILPPIPPDEIPFDIPRNWCWCRLGDLTELITKGSSPKWQGFKYVNNGVLFITSENVGNEVLKLTQKKYVEEKFNVAHSSSILNFGDILTNIVGASIGRSTRYELNIPANINQAVALIRLIEKNLSEYIVKYLNSPVAYKIMMSQKVETARANISLKNISEFLIPLPPLAEQKRIVERLEELLPLCEI